MVSVFRIIFDSIIEGKTIPSGPEGYYFVENGIIPTLDIVKKTVEVLHDLGKINTLELREWTNDELFASNVRTSCLHSVMRSLTAFTAVTTTILWDQLSNQSFKDPPVWMESCP